LSTTDATEKLRKYAGSLKAKAEEIVIKKLKP